MDKLTNINIKSLFKKIMNVITVNRTLFTAMIILLAGSFILIRINSYSRPKLDEVYLKEQLLTLTNIEFDQVAIDKIQELVKTNVNITSNFTQRDNPFADN